MELAEDESNTATFWCDWQACNKSWKKKSDLERHYRIHTNERPFPCVAPGCGKTFIQRAALKIHIRTHTGEKPFQCSHKGCGKRFSDTSILARHHRTHTGVQPYTCHVCIKSFAEKSNLLRHQRCHESASHLSKLSNRETFESDNGGFNSTPQHSGPTLRQQGVEPLHQIVSYAPTYSQQAYVLNGSSPNPRPRAPGFSGYNPCLIPEINCPGIPNLTPVETRELLCQMETTETSHASGPSTRPSNTSPQTMVQFPQVPHHANHVPVFQFLNELNIFPQQLPMAENSPIPAHIWPQEFEVPWVQSNEGLWTTSAHLEQTSTSHINEQIKYKVFDN
ncbi:hypothetical protein BKA65DRAFT_550341 [Rhexocercosporidium sp. MPI-PUGE-AT-0058]|nr:hypothetical protein BKA65DRAFT_550341 [Rhexocercosporidium sp. MPI-PUGE-AT-0058]